MTDTQLDAGSGDTLYLQNGGQVFLGYQDGIDWSHRCYWTTTGQNN